MFLLCVSWMSLILLQSCDPVLTRFYGGFCVRIVLVACDMFIFPRICLCCENVLELFVLLLFVDFISITLYITVSHKPFQAGYQIHFTL